MSSERDAFDAGRPGPAAEQTHIPLIRENGELTRPVNEPPIIGTGHSLEILARLPVRPFRKTLGCSAFSTSPCSFHRLIWFMLLGFI